MECREGAPTPALRVLDVRRAKRLKYSLKLGFASGVQRIARSDQAKEHRQHAASLHFYLPQVDHYCVQQFAGKRNVFLLHDDERVENNVAKEHAGNGQDGDYDLPETSNFAGALYYAGRHHEPDKDRAVKKDVIYGVGDEAPGEAAYRRRAHSQHQPVRIIGRDGVIVDRGLVQLLAHFFLAGGTDKHGQPVQQCKRVGGVGSALLAPPVEWCGYRLDGRAQVLCQFGHFFGFGLSESVGPFPTHEVSPYFAQFALLDRGAFQRGFHLLRLIQFFEAQQNHEHRCSAILSESDSRHVVIARAYRAARFLVPWALLGIVPQTRQIRDLLQIFVFFHGLVSSDPRTVTSVRWVCRQ